MTSWLVIFRVFFFFRPMTLNLKKNSRKYTNKKFWPYWLISSNKPQIGETWWCNVKVQTFPQFFLIKDQNNVQNQNNVRKKICNKHIIIIVTWSGVQYHAS